MALVLEHTNQKYVVSSNLGLISPLFQSNPSLNSTPNHETFRSLLKWLKTKESKFLDLYDTSNMLQHKPLLNLPQKLGILEN